jgi:NTP pyrophosphatase (non-canonical NTP hydrolase)
MGMSLSNTQRIVDDWIGQFEEGYWPPLSMLASIIEEVGELAREINSLEGYKTKKSTKTKVSLGEELGDLIFSIVCLANYYKIDLEDVFKKAIEKYTKRDVGRWTYKKEGTA